MLKLNLKFNFTNKYFSFLDFSQDINFRAIKPFTYIKYGFYKLVNRKTKTYLKLHDKAKPNYIKIIKECDMDQKTQFQLENYFKNNSIFEIEIIELKLIK